MNHKSYSAPDRPITVITHHMDSYLTEQQVEELENFDHIEKDLADLIEDEEKFNINDYLNSNIDY